MEKPGLLRRVGNCGACLELDRAWIAWEGTLEGRLILAGGKRTQDLVDVGVWLLTTSPQGVSVPSAARRWGTRLVPALQRLDLPFSLELGWGHAAIGGLATVRAVMTLPGSLLWSTLQSPRVDISVPIQVVAPADFAQAAAMLAELTSLKLGDWAALGTKGAAIDLHAGPSQSALRSARLSIRREAIGCTAEVAVDPLRGLPARAEVRLPAGDPEGVRQALAECLGQFQYGVAELPIPAGRPGHDSTTLPRPAMSGAPSLEQLPLPSEPGSSPQ
jgi:hypothetical protein